MTMIVRLGALTLVERLAVLTPFTFTLSLDTRSATQQHNAKNRCVNPSVNRTT